MRQCDQHIMSQQPSRGTSDAGWGRRCDHCNALAPDFVLLFWTLPEVMNLCRRRKEAQSWLLGRATRHSRFSCHHGREWKPMHNAVHNVVHTGQLTIDGRKQVPQEGDVCTVTCRRWHEGFWCCHSASGAGAATTSACIFALLTCEICVLADGVLKIDVACTAAALMEPRVLPRHGTPDVVVQRWQAKGRGIN